MISIMSVCQWLCLRTNLPDLMLVGSIEDLRQLVALDLIEDLTKSYENCLTDRIKDIYASYGEGIIDGVTFDGKIMAIPETNIDDGPNLLWLSATGWIS